MNKTINKENSKIEKSPRRFLSISDLRQTHRLLLKNYHSRAKSFKFNNVVQEFIQSGQILGELLDGRVDRWAAEGILDYWATVLFREGYDTPDVLLAEFDPNLAEDLDPKLCPYLGLDAFEEEDQAKFFGRQGAVDELIEKLRGSRLVSVVGSSGSGKSSLIRAGLIPQLKAGRLERSDDWNYYPSFTPGANPLESLVRAIHPPKRGGQQWIKTQIGTFQNNPKQLAQLITALELGVSSVIFVDQFEEVFTLCAEESLRQAFINNLYELIHLEGSRHIVILTMRIDFADRLTQFQAFHSVIRKNTHILLRLQTDELREVIEGPANLVSLKFEEDVVNNLIEEVRDDKAPLPLLQFALLKLWDSKERNRITMKAYSDLGGAHGALPTIAEKLYSSLSTEEQLATRHILVKLCRQPESGQEVTRDRLTLKQIYEDNLARDRIDWSLSKLIDTQLIRMIKGESEEDTVIEVAHEALIRNWERLSSWLDEERIYKKQRDRLKIAADHWDATGRDPGTLWHELDLAIAETYKDLNPLEESFIQTSKDAIKAVQDLEIKRQLELQKAQIEVENERKNAEKERRNVQKFRKLNQELQIERDRAKKQANLAFSRELAAAAINNLSVDPERSILLAIYAVYLTQSFGEGVSPEAEDALHRAV